MQEKASFGVLLKHYRLAAGLSQEALAARASLSTRAISDLERGINRTPRYDTLELLVNALPLSAQQREVLRAAAYPAMAPCIGYLDHPFKNKPFETEKEILSLLANTGGLVYNQTSSTAYSCSNDDTLT